MRLVSVNSHRYCLNNNRKMHYLNEAIKSYDVGALTLNEVNVKWNTMDTSSIERRIKQMCRAAKIVASDSGQCHIASDNYLLGGS